MRFTISLLVHALCITLTGYAIVAVAVVLCHVL